MFGKKLDRNNKGFTLIELLIVVAIIGILAAVGAAVIPGLLGGAKEKVVKQTHSEVVSYINSWKGKCMLVQGVADRAKTEMTGCRECVTKNTPYGGSPQDFTGVCNTPLTNLNWMFAGHFVVNGSKNPYDNTEVGVDAKECGHNRSCYDTANHLGVTYINVISEAGGGNLYWGKFQIKSFYKDGTDPLISTIYWDGRE